MRETTLYPPPRPLTVGEVLDLSFRIYGRTFVKCLVFGGFVVVSSWLPNIYLLAHGQSAFQGVVRPHLDPGYWITLVIGMVLALMFPVAIVYRQYNMITDRPVGGELARAMRMLGRIVLIYILLILLGTACGLLLIPAMFATGVWRYLLVALLLLPLAYVFLRLISAFTAMAVEDTGATASLGRSWQLAGGNVLRLLAIYTVAFFLLLVVYIVVGSLGAFLSIALGRGDVALIAAVVGVMTVAAGALVSPYFAALSLAVFGDLVVRKEGADLSQRISAA